MKITRYMSFAKFLSFLKDGFFIPKATLFDDRWEGLLPIASLDIAKFRGAHKLMKKAFDWFYVSCWHKGIDENHAMWKMYGLHEEAVAIVTSTEKLTKVFLDSSISKFATLDEVQYKLPDRNKKIPLPSNIKRITKPFAKIQDVPDLAPFTRFLYLKHKAFKFESEIRLVTIDPLANLDKDNTEKGIRIKTDQKFQFIDKIIVSPNSPKWYFSMIKDVCKKYDCPTEPQRSKIDFP